MGGQSIAEAGRSVVKRADTVRLLAPIVAALISMAVASSARAEFRLGPGDVVEISAASVPESRQRLMVQMDGVITLSQVGDVAVAGLTPGEFRARVQAVLSSAVLHVLRPDGHETLVTPRPDEIGAAIVEFRPVYVTGDVIKSGEQPFRAGMNVRQAVAIAGGYGLPKTAEFNPMMTVDLRAEARTLWRQCAAARAKIWRLRSELGAKEDLAPDLLGDVPLPDEVLTQIVALERQTLRSWEDERAHEEDFLRHAVAQVGATIAVVTQQKTDEEKGTQADVQDLRAVLDLMTKGNVTASRVNEARRAVLLASTRNLQTQAELLRLQRVQDDFSQQLTKHADDRHVAVAQELNPALADLDAAGIKLGAVQEKLQLAGVVLQKDGNDLTHPEFTVYRKEGTADQRLGAADETELQPGDVVEVKFSGTQRVATSNR